MKKLSKVLSVFAAVAMLGTAFIGCSDGGSSGGSGGEPETPETPENSGGGDPENTTELVATVWSVDDYISDLGTTDGTVAEGKVLGFVTAVKEVAYAYKDPSAGTGSNTWTGVTDVGYYSSFSVNADGNTEKKVLKIAVPSDAKAISVFGKCGSSTNTSNLTLASGADNVVKSVDLPDATWKTILDKEDISSYAGSDLFIYNGKAGTGKLTIKAIIIWKEAKLNPKPAATNFTPVSTKDGYSITVTDPTGIEYSTDNGTTWNDATATITLDTYGKVLFRTKATDDAGASSTVEVTVEEYVDTSKPQADKPSVDNFTVVKSANGNDGSITLTSATGIEYKNGDVWEDAQASYTGLAAGTYSFRTKETEEKRASEALEVTVEAFVLPETYVANEWNFENADNFKFSGIAVKGSANACELATTAEKGYLGRKLTTVEGLYVEFAGAGKGLGYANVEHDSGTRPTVFVPAIASTEALQGPFKVEVVLGNASATRTVKLFVSATKDDLFADASVVKSEALNSQTVSYIYTGTDAKFIGFGTLPDQTEGSNLGKVYTNIKSVKVTCAEEIPAETYAATAVAFSNEGIVSNNEITISKKQAEDNFQLTTTLTPSYTTDAVTFTKVSGDEDISVSEDGKVSVAADYSKNAAVVVKATAGSAEATLTVNVNAAIALTADAVVTISGTNSILTTGDTTLSYTLDKDYTDISSIQWKVNGSAVEGATTATYKFSNETAGTYSVTVELSNGTATATSAAYEVVVKNPPISVADGVATLVDDSYTNGLTKTAMDAAAWITYVSDGWQSNKTYGDFTGDFVNASKDARYIVAKVKGAAEVEIAVYNTTAGRTYLVNGTSVTHTGTGLEVYKLSISDTSGTTTIKISGDTASTKGSVYPTSITLKKTATPAD